MEKLYRQLLPQDDENGLAASTDKAEASMIIRPTQAETMKLAGRYHLQHLNAAGELLHEEEFDNLWTDLGRRSILNVYLDRSTAMTSIFMGLKGAGTPVSADTIASHASWTEIASSVVALRIAPAFAAATGTTTVSKATSSAVSFPIVTATNIVIAGCFILMNGIATPGDTTGTGVTLLTVGDFGASRTVNSGDTLNVSYTASLT